MADSPMINETIATGPRAGSSHASVPEGWTNEYVVIGHISNPGLQDASGPTRDGGCGPLVQWRSCIQEEGTMSTIPASRHPTDHFQLLPRESTTWPGCRRREELRCPE